MGKLGLIAGGGTLPLSLADHCLAAGRPLFVVRLKGFALPRLADFAGEELGLGQLGRAIKLLKQAGCEAVCFAGGIRRPDFSTLRLDARGVAALPGILKAASRGDDALLTFVLGIFEKEGFRIEGAHEVVGELLLPEGPLGRHAPDAAQSADVAKALDVARAIGRLDVGQAAVVCAGLVLAVEAQEGTDAMVGRVAGLPEAIRGAPARRAGVLAKAAKPIQDTRVDLPTIGPATLEVAARAGLAGIAGEAGRVLVLERARCVALADELGLFVVGVAAGPG